VTQQLIVISKTVKESLAICSKFDDNVKNRIKYYKNFFSKHMSNLPNLRTARRLFSKCRLYLSFKKCQMNPEVKEYKPSLQK
jgi:hypothetical protein